MEQSVCGVATEAEANTDKTVNPTKGSLYVFRMMHRVKID